MQNSISQNKIELISVDLLDENRLLADELKHLNYALGFTSGWHYLLDWIWTIRQLNEVNNKKILDAGAGIGLLQWYLALHNSEVLSVDRSGRKVVPFHLLQHFQVSPYTASDKFLPLGEFFKPSFQEYRFAVWVKAFLRGMLGSLRTRTWETAPGSIRLYGKDLRDMPDIPDNSIDYVVSISALEHNTPDDLRIIVRELERILKPGGAMVVTISAARDADWYFKPASGWCYTDKSIKEIFGLSDQDPSNYDCYDELHEKLKRSKELKSNMTWYYYYSPLSGMPWGIWRPQYLPVGIVKVKPV
ncbi:MAG: class I SAM-dependent methyltransferase [Chloroflexi bacterium]|nr:class I SAM-dependent methyltransferase [Chloroflexota bacterium]